MQLLHGNILTEILFLIKHLAIGIAFYLIISKKDKSITYKSDTGKISPKKFLIFIIPYAVIVTVCNFIIPDHLMLLLYFVLFFTYYNIQLGRKMNFLSDSLLVITVDFLILILEWISLFMVTVIDLIISRFVTIFYKSEIITLIFIVIFSCLVYVVNSRDLFNTSIIRKMMKHKVMAISQVLAWALAITLSVINKYLIGQEYTLRLYIGCAFLFMIYGVIAVYHYNREKRIERFKTTLKEANDVFYTDAALAHEDGHIKEDIAMPAYAPKPGHENKPESGLDEYNRKMGARREYFKNEYENALAKTDYFLVSNKLKYGTNQYFYLCLAIYFAYHSIRTEQFYDPNSICIDYIAERIAHYHNLRNDKKINEQKAMFYIRRAIRSSISHVADPKDRVKLLSQIDDKSKAVNFMKQYVFTQADIFLADRYDIADKNPKAAPSLY